MSLCSSKIGICHSLSLDVFPAYKSYLVISQLLVNKPAVLLPKAVTIAPVRVESQIRVEGVYFWRVQVIVSAKVSLPQASVFPISTVSPFLDLIISDGLKAFQLMLFSANPKLAVTFTFSLSFEMALIAARTEQDPCLSKCMPSIPLVVFMFSPPESKHSPFPTKAIHSSDVGFPLQLRLTNLGLQIEALPTASRRFRFQALIMSSFTTIISSPHQVATLRHSYSMNSVVPTLAL